MLNSSHNAPTCEGQDINRSEISPPRRPPNTHGVITDGHGCRDLFGEPVRFGRQVAGVCGGRKSADSRQPDRLVVRQLSVRVG